MYKSQINLIKIIILKIPSVKKKQQMDENEHFHPMMNMNHMILTLNLK
jgi:hypothetical protein